MKYNKSEIMKKAWELFRNPKMNITFSESLHRACNSAKAKPVNDLRIEQAKQAAGITEEINTWSGWYDLGFEVIHESKMLFQVELIYASKGDGAVYKASFFGKSQVVPVGTQPPKQKAA